MSTRTWRIVETQTERAPGVDLVMVGFSCEGRNFVVSIAGPTAMNFGDASDALRAALEALSRSARQAER